jgi:hypothetical protein
MSKDMQGELGDLKKTVREIAATVAGHTQELAGHTRDLASLKTTVRNIAITVSGHTETLSRMEKQLSKLDILDVIAKQLDVSTAEIIASRNERTLMGKNFFDQQEMLTDHELRLTRLEPRDKQS